MTDDPRPNVFGPVLRRMIQNRALTMTHVAKESGLDHSMISRLCSGERHATRPTVIDVGYAIGANEQEMDALLVAAGFAPVSGDMSWSDPSIVRLAAALATIAKEGDDGAEYAATHYQQLNALADLTERLTTTMRLVATGGRK